MVKVMNFTGGAERSVEQLAAEVRAERARPENRDRPERAVVRSALESFSNRVPAPAAPAPAAPAADARGDETLLPAYLAAGGDPAVKREVERLLTKAFRESIEAAVRDAKGRPPFILDALHDALVDRLIPELKRRGAL